MSTLDESMTDPDKQTNHTELERITIGDLVVWHAMPFFSVRELTQLNCPRWSMQESKNIVHIAKARMLDDNRDWYFPIIAKNEKPMIKNDGPTALMLIVQFEEDASLLLVKGLWSSWSAIWHLNPQHASGRALSLPPMTYLPHEWIHFIDPRVDVIASAGGPASLESGALPIIPTPG